MKGEVTNILWVRIDSIGDAVLSASMLPHIRREYPQARITVLCREHIVPLYLACPYVDDVVGLDKPRALKDERYRQEITDRLRMSKPELSLNSVYSREALADWFAIKCGADRRVALQGDLCNISAELRDLHNQFFTDLLPSPGQHKLELERHGDFLAGLGIRVDALMPMIWTTAQDEEFAERVFQESGLDPSKTIALFAGAQYDCRLYEGYGEALYEFCRTNDLQIVALGTAQDGPINQRNLDRAGTKSVDLSGKTTILQSAAVLRRCRLAVGAETGLAHICCAVGTPNVILLGGGHFGRFMPYSPLSSIASLPLECFGCNWNCRYTRACCVRDVAPEVLAEALHRSFSCSSEVARIFIQPSSAWNPSPGQPAWAAEFDRFVDLDGVQVITVGRRAGVEATPVVLGRDSARRITAPQDTVRKSPGGPIDTRITIATSIAPGDIETQRTAVDSWRKLGFDVVSLNCPDEISALREVFPDVRFVEVRREAGDSYGRPLVYFDEFLRYFRSQRSRICGIVNSDIHLISDQPIVPFIESHALDGLVYGPRTDVDSLDELQGEPCQTGFDFFFFDRSLIPCFPPSEFRIGLPWWDHWVPLVSILEGFATKRLISPFAYHIRHPSKWDKDEWLVLAKKLFGHLRPRIDRDMAEAPRSPWAALGRTFANHHRRYLREKGIDDTTQMSVGIILPAVVEFLGAHSEKITYEKSAFSPKPSLSRAASRVPAGSRAPIHHQQRGQAQYDLSIVLCTKNRAGLLDQMLNSLEEATAGVAYEVIAVEGGSSDETLNVLQNHGVRSIYDESRSLGPGKHSWPELFNFGFARAVGKWAMYASDDIVFHRDAVARAIDLLERQKDNVAGGIFFYRNIRPTSPEWSEFGIDFASGMKLLMNYGLVKLEHFRQVGGFCGDYRFYCADTDFCYRLYQEGLQLIPLPGCFVTRNNRLDAQKLANMALSGADIELCRRRWGHIVGDQPPRPMRLLWQEDLREAFEAPADLQVVDCGIEYFWQGLAWFQRGVFFEAEQKFIEAVKSGCDHRQVLWFLARAAHQCADVTLAEKASAAVLRLAPDFEPALDLLVQAAQPSAVAVAEAACQSRDGLMEADLGLARPDDSAVLGGPVMPDDSPWACSATARPITAVSSSRRIKRRRDGCENDLRRRLRRFNKVVVWGLKTQQHTHAHIHRHFFNTLEKLGIPVAWVDDSKENAPAIRENDLVIAVDVASLNMPVKPRVYYCLHNCPEDIHRAIEPSRNIRLRTYTASAERAGQKWDLVTFFDRETRTLYQPWATDLLACEFQEPLCRPSSNIVFWVGSVWNDALGRGNVNEIETLRDVLARRNIRFIHLQGISDSLNIRYVRNSLIAPAIAGRWQVENDYLPCRMWKNISYGQLGISNVRKFGEIFAGCTVEGSSIEELIDNALSLPARTYREITRRQQQIVRDHHTYVNRLLSIIRAFESVEDY